MCILGSGATKKITEYLFYTYIISFERKKKEIGIKFFIYNDFHKMNCLRH